MSTALFCSCLAWCLDAAAYVQSRDEVTGKPLRWRGGEVVFTLSAAHGSQALPPDAVAEALRKAGVEWTAGAPAIAFRVEPPSARADRARRDGVNAVLVHERSWCRDGVRARLSCYDPDEQAMTTTYLERNPRTGEVFIAEADIEINAVHYRWRTPMGRPVAGAGEDRSLANLLVHELGHVLGLAHDCDDGPLPPAGRPPDAARLPSCEEVPAQISAMFPNAPPAGVVVTPTDDERRAIREIYSDLAREASGSSGKSSSVGGLAFGALIVAGLLAIAAFGRRLKRGLTGGRTSC